MTHLNKQKTFCCSLPLIPQSVSIMFTCFTGTNKNKMSPIDQHFKAVIKEEHEMQEQVKNLMNQMNQIIAEKRLEQTLQKLDKMPDAPTHRVEPRK
jgi:hypothetical protein